MSNDLLRRQGALERTAKRFRSKPYAFGRADCIVLLRAHLVAMGHRGLPKLPRYRSAVGARRALKNMGHDNLEQLIDGLLPRIAPAAMLPGDVALMRSDDEFGAVTVSFGSKLMGWAEGYEESVMIVPLQIEAAWRA